MASSALPAREAGHQVENFVSGAGRIESGAELLSSVALVAMIGLIGAEAIVRNLFGGSLQITDEVCGYLLVAVTFLSMSVSEAHGAFHRVELVQAHLRVRTRLTLLIAFDIVSFGASVLITWQLVRLALNAWNSGDVAPTPLQTPLWLPQMFMGIGMLLLCFALLRSMRAKYRCLQMERQQ